MTLTKWLEMYANTAAYANSNAANRPALIQVLGDSLLGAKVFGGLSKVFFIGGALTLQLVNGTGAVGLDGDSTSVKFHGLSTLDLRGMTKPLPLRFSMNMAYAVDDSGGVLVSTREASSSASYAHQRFGLRVNRVDHFDIRLGGEVMLAQERVRPFLEYGVNIR